MRWNYRVVQHEDYWGLHEIYYNDNGDIEGYTEADVVGNDHDDLVKTIKLMLKDATQTKLLQASDLPKDRVGGS